MPKIIPPRKHSYSKLEPILIKSSMAEDVKFSENKMTVYLKDGRELSVPLTWFPRLKSATGTALENWLFIGGGEGIHWKAVDEDLLVENLF